jgi:tRNA splicing ligase
LVSYDADNDDLFVTTKSQPDGLAANLLRDMLKRKVSPENLNKIKDYCKEHDVTFVFECVDMENDPHIIDYPESRLFLLAVVNNTIAYSQMEYTALQNIGAEFGLEVKEKAYEIANWQEFIKWYDAVRLPDWEYNGRVIEGFVIEDANGFMTKLKLHYYCMWKHLRSVSGVVLRQGYIVKTSQLVTPTENMFYGWLKNLWENTDKEARNGIPKNIVHLRRMFYESGYTGTYDS